MFYSKKNNYIEHFIQIFLSGLFFIILIVFSSYAKANSIVETGSVKEIKKISDAINLAGNEYKLSVENKKIIMQEEYKEANMFLEQAQKNMVALETKISREKKNDFDKAKTQITQIIKIISDKENPEIMLKQVKQADIALENLAGTTLKEFPLLAPSINMGQQVFAQNCAVCHGVKGFGDGPSAATLEPKPVNFHDLQFMRESSPYSFYRAVKNGINGTGMPSWEYQLSLKEKWAVIQYVRQFSFEENSLKKGKLLFDKYSGFDYSKIIKINDNADKSDQNLFNLLKKEPVFSQESDDNIFNLINYLRTEKTTYKDIKLTAENILSKKENIEKTINEIKTLLDASRKSYNAGNFQEAINNTNSAYLSFEPIEKELGAKDTPLARKLELNFNSLKGFYGTSGNIEKVDALISEIEQGLEKSIMILTVNKQGLGLFLQSMFLIMREGFEAIIIIAALITFVKKATPDTNLERNIYKGVILGLLASIATAFILESILKNSTFSKEFIEGFTVLLAAAILFYVSHWLISKTQAQQWQTFIRSTLKNALSGKNQLAIASVGFLSVYREGFETILFYKALLTTSNSNQMIVTGFLAGCVALAVISVLFYKFSVKIPIREFFIVTGLLLYYMVFSFVGKGIHELQEGNMLSITGLNYIPEIDFIGLYPTVETTLAQIIILLAWVGAVIYSFISSRLKNEQIIEKPAN